MLIFDLINPQELVGYVRGLAYEENLNRFLLSQFLPQQDLADTEFRIIRGNLLDVDAATFRSFDAESPIAKRQGGTRISGQIPPISRKIRLGEEERLRLRALQSGDQGAVIDAIYNDAALMTRSILTRLELARGSVLTSGTLVLAENGVAATIDYGRKGGHSVTAGTLWSDLTNSDPVTDLRTWQSTYLLSNGILPAGMILSSAVIANLLRNAKIRALGASIAGAPNLVSVATLNTILDQFGLPAMIPYDSVFRVAGTQTRPIPSNVVIFVPPSSEPLGAVFTGITAEALELVEGGFLLTEEAAGIVSVIDKSFDPVSRWTKAAALALPVLANPDLTFKAVVQ